jgi:hypothetical protein
MQLTLLTFLHIEMSFEFCNTLSVGKSIAITGAIAFPFYYYNSSPFAITQVSHVRMCQAACSSHTHTQDVRKRKHTPQARTNTPHTHTQGRPPPLVAQWLKKRA